MIDAFSVGIRSERVVLLTASAVNFSQAKDAECRHVEATSATHFSARQWSDIPLNRLQLLLGELCCQRTSLGPQLAQEAGRLWSDKPGAT